MFRNGGKYVSGDEYNEDRTMKANIEDDKDKNKDIDMVSKLKME